MVNHLGLYGTPEMIHIHDDPQVKYPTEVLAAGHIYNPTDARYIPAPQRPLEIWCWACKRLKKPDEFHNNRTRPNGKHSECKACRKAGKKRAPHRLEEHWYRNKTTLGQK